MSATPALQGIRVLDASRILAGPYCGQLLADNGAEVIKIESPEGDQNRAWTPLVDGQGTNFLCVNRGKQGITLNLKSEEGRRILHELVRGCDVFIHNFLPKVAEKLEVDYETLSRLNPDLVYVCVSGYGATGPLRDRPGYDMMVSAYCGIMGLTGDPNGPPARVGVPVLDTTTGILAYGAVTTALLARAEGRARGQRIDVSLLETGIALLGYRAINWLLAHHLEPREGSRYLHMTPYGAFRCGDGELMIGVPNDRDWQKLCGVLGSEALRDERFQDNAGRCAHVAEVTSLIEASLAERTVAEMVDTLTEAGIACAPISNVAQVLAEEQVHAVGMIADAPTRSGGVMPLLGVPFKLSATPTVQGSAPPPLGADTEAVLARWLGLGSDEVARLREQGVV